MKQFLRYLFVAIGFIAISLTIIGLVNTSFSNSAIVTIKERAHKVFAVYNNPLLMNHWLKDFKSAEKTQGKLNQVGSQWLISFKSKGKEAVTLQKTLKEFKLNQQISYDFQNNWLSGRETISFTRNNPTSTVLTLEQRYSGTGILQNAFFFFMQDGIAQANQKNLERLKKLVEDSKVEDFIED